MPARRAKRSTRTTPRKRVRKTVVTLKPTASGKATSGSATSGKGTGGNAAQAKIQELEAENRQLKAQLADQKNSSTMISASLARPERSYRGMAITFAVTTIVLLVVVVLMSM